MPDTEPYYNSTAQDPLEIPDQPEKAQTLNDILQNYHSVKSSTPPSMSTSPVLSRHCRLTISYCGSSASTLLLVLI